MKRFIIWFYYLSKRQLKNIFFLFVLLLIPISALTLKLSGSSLNATIAIGITDLDKSSLSEEFISSLSSYDNDHVVSFIVYDNISNMNNDVLAGKIQCGYSVLPGFQDNISDSRLKNLIDVHSKPDNSMVLLSNELLFTYVFKEAGYYTLIRDMENANIFGNISDEDYNRLKNDYLSNLSNDRTFSFNYSQTNGTYISSNNINILNYIQTPVRGIIALFIFISGLAGGFTFLKDSKNKVTNRLCIFDIGIPVIFASISGTIALFIVGTDKSIPKEIITMVCYSLLVILFVILITKLLRNNITYCSAIPVFSLGSLFCCPIFINLKTFLPVINILQYLFMPTYYFILCDIFF